MKHLAFLIVVALASPASAFVADNDMVVEQGTDGLISVPWRGSSATTDFWCAAGDYAAKKLNAKGNDILWRVSPLPRHSGEGIMFSTTPPETPLKVSFLASETGQMSVAMARSFCNPLPVFIPAP
jgi:hypothetical protein